MAARKEGPVKTINLINTVEEKERALLSAIANIEKDFGAGAVMFLGGDKATRLNIEAIPSGSLTLDIALGIGGFPRGRIVEIYGPESGGKTTVTLQAIAEAQKLGGTAAFVDVEHALDPSYAKKLGVNIDKLLVSQPDTGEQALEIMERLGRSGAVDIIVLDSVAAMVTKAEIDGLIGDAYVGVQARLMSAALRKLTSVIGKTNTVAIFINQIREKIGGYNPTGRPLETTPGGRALKFYSSIRVDVRRGDQIKEGGVVTGYRTKCTVKKNKVAPPFKVAEFDMIFGQGVSKLGEILDIATDIKVIRKSGSWYYFNEERLGQGRDAVRQFLIDNPAVADEIERRVREKSNEVELGSGSDDIISSSEISGNINKEKFTPEQNKNGVTEVDEDFDEFSPDEI